MRIERWIGVAAVAAVAMAAAQAQSAKPGLWETTATMRMEGVPAQPNIPPETLAKMQAMGVQLPSSNGNTTKSEACITSAMIEQYGGPKPQPQNGCEVTNVHRTGAGMTADLVCTGRLTGKGSVKATRVDSDHSNTTMHFAGTAKGGHPVEWTMESSSKFLGPNCGNVQPDRPAME